MSAGDFCLNCMEPLDGGSVCGRCGSSAQAPERMAHHLPAGTLLANGRYLVGRALGQGGFGITYIGRDLTLNIRVAVKEYYPTLYVGRASEETDSVVALDPKFRERLETGRRRFLDEARVLAKFHGNPGIVDVRDFFEQNGTAYIVMDYLEGETLKDYLQHAAIAADRMFELVRPILDTLELIHDSQVIHRDISPDNIMMLSSGELCLMDFGAARELDCLDNRTMSMVLKAGYAPEEQYRAKGELGPWTDIYALCATMYRAITGVAPDESLQRLIADEMAWPREMGVRMSEAQEAVLKKGMAPKRSERYQSVAELKADLVAMPSKEEEPPPEDESLPEEGRSEEKEPISEEIAVMREGRASSAGLAGLSAGEEASAPDGAPIAAETLAPAETSAAAETPAPDETSAAAETPAPAETSAAAETPAPDDPPAPIGTSEPALRRGKRRKLVGVLIAIAVACIAVALGAFYLYAPAYTVSFDTAGGSAVEPMALNRVEAASEPQAPVREGYEFRGWFLDESLHDKADFPLKVESDTVLHAAWEKTRASYRVDYLDDVEGGKVADSKKVDGAEVGSKVTEEAPDIDGYALKGKPRTKLAISEDDAANVIEFHYRKLVSYEVRYLESGTDSEVAPAKTVSDAVEQTEVTEQAPDVEGYTLESEAEQSITPGRDEQDNVLVFYYKPAPVQQVAQTPAYDQGQWDTGATYYPSGGDSDSGSGDSSGGDSGSQSSDSSGDSGSGSDSSDDVEWAN